MPEAELLYEGRPLQDLTREELIKAIQLSHKMHQAECRRHKLTMDMMAASRRPRESGVYNPLA